MNQIPVTFFYNFDCISDCARNHVMHEFAANGAKHLVLTDALILKMMADRNLAATLQKEMAQNGLTFMDSHAPFGKYLDLNCPLPEARGEMIARHKLPLQMIASMGVKTITIHTGNEPAFPEYPLETQFDCVKHSLDELLPLAEKLGIVICIENIWFQINTPERLLAIKAAFPTDALGFCYDAGHANLMDNGRHCPDSNAFKAWGEVPPSFDDRILEKMLPYVVNCHLHDNNGINDQHRNIGHGNINWDHIAGLLKTAPALQVIQSEVLPVTSNEPVREICQAFARLFR